MNELFMGNGIWAEIPRLDIRNLGIIIKKEGDLGKSVEKIMAIIGWIEEKTNWVEGFFEDSILIND